MARSGSSKPNPTRLPVIVLFAGLIAASHAHAAGEGDLFGSVGSLVLRNTKIGSELIESVTGIESQEVTDQAYRSFVERMGWRENSAVRAELSDDFDQIQNELSEYRQQHNLPAELGDGEQLSQDQIDFLERAAEALRSNKLENLLLEANTLIEIKKPGYEAIADEFMSGGSDAAAESLGEGEVPKLPHDDPAPISPRAAQLKWYAKIALRFRAYKNFFRAFELSEGQWKTLFGRDGRNFTVEDLKRIRKLNRLLDGLNDYAKTRLVIRSFANERPYLYSRLNEMTADAVAKYSEGTMSMDELLNARKEAAKQLQMSDVVGEAETRMLTALQRCAELGGGRLAGATEKGLIELAENNIRGLEQQESRVSQGIAKAKQALAEAKAAGNSARATEIERKLVTYQSDLDLARQRKDVAAKDLSKLYAEFVSHYDTLDIFANLRRGRVNSEVVRPFDMPGIFTVDPDNLKGWGDVYNRALYNSTNDLVLDETKLFFQTRAGATRKFVRDMNDMTEKYFGKKFTETHYGAEFRQYEQHIFVVGLQRAGALVGVTIPSGLAIHYADRLWNSFFADDPSKKPAGDDTGSDSSSGDSSSGSNDQSTADDGSGAKKPGKPSAKPAATTDDNSQQQQQDLPDQPSADDNL